MTIALEGGIEETEAIEEIGQTVIVKTAGARHPARQTLTDIFQAKIPVPLSPSIR
jgi:hypothetical protein